MYSNKWCFRFKATKSCVLVFCPKYCTFNETFQWFLGQCSIPTADKYNHLGIIVDNRCKLFARITEACNKGRKSYFALSDIGSQFLNPMTLSHLYKKVVLPSALYGCEQWNCISSSDHSLVFYR